MTRHDAREVAMHILYAQIFSDRPTDALLAERLADDAFSRLAPDCALYQNAPDPVQREYICQVVRGTCDHLAELDHYIEKYAIGWNFGRISRTATAILRLAMYEILYRPDIPNAAAIDEAVELAKAYDTTETAAFINGVLGSFVRKEMPQ